MKSRSISDQRELMRTDRLCGGMMGAQIGTCELMVYREGIVRVTETGR